MLIIKWPTELKQNVFFRTEKQENEEHSVGKMSLCFINTFFNWLADFNRLRQKSCLPDEA